MKRTIMTLAVALGVAAATQAQNYLVNNPDNKAYFGVRAGLDISSTAGQIADNYGNGAGFTLGAIYNIPLWQNLYFEPGLHLFYNTFDYDVLVEPEGMPAEIFDGSIRNWGFRVPLNFGYHFDFTDDISISVFTGPVVNLNLKARTSCGDYDKRFDADYGYSLINNGFRRVDLQWDFGVSMNYGMHYYVAMSGGIGMTKVYGVHYDDDSFRRNTFNISVGYNF
ncbi:MAG: PorT family protein [Clostridiales bacterium]|nr:PorT family protein [Clostridiales bacterium]